MNEEIKLFFTGFLQVYFVAINTYFISTKNLYGTVVAGFIISLIWSFNVKKIAFGNTSDRFVYAFGAAFGSLCGLAVSIVFF